MTYRITLSFDNGPAAGVTAQVLSVLRKHDIRATFFVVGAQLESPQARELMHQAFAEGHWIGNHTYSHSQSLGTLRESGVAVREIKDAQDQISAVAHPSRLFRPHGNFGQLGPHLLNSEALQYLMQERYTCVLWNVIAREWERPNDWVEPALQECRSRPWSMLVLHDIETGAMAHLDEFICKAKEEGASFHQDFPPDCVPLDRGREVLPLSPYVSI